MTRSLAIVLALVGATAIARADSEVPDRAKELADRGRQLHHDGRYADAIEAYKAAYVLAPSPGLLFNLAQAYRLSGDCDDAAWMYHRYLESEPTDEARAIASAHLERLEACSHGGFRVTIAPEPVPPPPVVPVVSTTIIPTPPEPPPPAPAAGHRSTQTQIGTWLAVGGGGALVVASIAALDARNTSNEVSDAYAHHAKSADLRSLDERGQRSATIATVFGVTGGVAVISGAILYGLGRHYEEANHVAVIPHAHGASVSAAWRF